MITSRQNPKVKTVKKLLSSSKARRDTTTFVLESPTLIKEALNHHPELIQEILYTPTHSEFETIAHATLETIEISDDIAQHITSLKTSPGAFAILSYPHHQAPKTFQTALFLDGINKPSNMGAILRNAAAFNCNIIFISPTCCDPFHPESIRASAGHYASTPLVTSTLKKVTENTPDAQLIFCDSHANNTVMSKLNKLSNILVLGSENGLSDEAKSLQTPDNSIRIPMETAVESLNVAVTSGILLHTLYTTKSI